MTINNNNKDLYFYSNDLENRNGDIKLKVGDTICFSFDNDRGYMIIRIKEIQPVVIANHLEVLGKLSFNCDILYLSYSVPNRRHYSYPGLSVKWIK
jgi:hypothetical protein